MMMMMMIIIIIIIIKGKAIPLQAWSGPEGSRNLRLPDFMTTAHDGGKVFCSVPVECSIGTASKFSLKILLLLQHKK